jgi:DNA-binding SARP family transcriptional activator
MLTAARGGLIERAGLGATIASALERGSLLVVAGAGYGKTTSLRQALDRTGAISAWVRCGDAGGDAGRLLSLVVDAVCHTIAGAADALAEQLAGAREPVDPGRAALALERELASVLLEPLVIVFDDAETVAGAPAALDVISPLLTGDSEFLRVAVASRRRLAAPFARQRAMGQIAELGPAQLAFSAAECADYIRRAAGREPAPEEVESLLESTAGWPLGVGLALSAGDDGGAAPSPGLAHQYFTEEVLAPLEPPVRQALSAASTAPDLEVAERAGLAPPGGFAAAIERHGLLVDPAAKELHPLFREFLRARFAVEAPPDERRVVARAVADALERSGRHVEAIDYRLREQDWERAAAAIAHQGPELVRTAPGTVAAWLRAIPAAHADHPAIALLAGELAHGEGRFEDAVAMCRSAVERLEATGAPAADRFAAQFALADVLMAVGDLDGAGELAEVLEDPAATGSMAARAVAMVAAAATARTGRFEDGSALFARALDDQAAAPLAGLSPTFAAYYLDLPAGRLDDAFAHAHEAIAMLESDDPTGRLPYALAYLMAILEERGEDEEALAVSERTRARAGRMGLSGWVGAQLAIRSASIRARCGDTAGAETDLADVPPGWRAWGTWELEATRAAIASLRGDPEHALAAADRAVRAAQHPWPYFERVRCAELVAPILSGCGRPGRARKIVERTIETRPPGFSNARLHAVLAWLLHDEGDEAQSIGSIAAAWAEAGDQAKHVVRREWPRIERPLSAALERGALDVESAIEAVAAAQPGGEALGPLTRHPIPEVRRAALLGAVAAGHPEGIARVPELLRDPVDDVARAARAAAELLARDPPPLSFRLLGGFELRRGAWLVDDAAWERRVAQRVIRLLLCRGGGPVLEDELIEAFWPEKPAASARRSVQVAVSAARGVLDPPGVTESRLVCNERTYRLALRERDAVDSEQFEHAAEAALAAGPSGRRGALCTAAAMWGGEPLPEERYSEWAAPWRERLIDRYAGVLAALSDAHEQAGDTVAAVETARQLVELDPLNEAAHRRLILAFARAGRRGHALRQFLSCRRALVTELGVEPGEETAALQRRVLAGERI